MSQEKIQARVEVSSQQGYAATPGSQAGEGAGAAQRSSGSGQVPAGDVNASAGASSPSVLSRVGAWMAQTFPNCRHAVIGGICGLVVALLLFTIGVLKTLVIAVLVVCGVAVGQYFDGDPKLARTIQNLLKKH